MKLANKITLLRIVLAPILFLIFFIPLISSRWAVVSVFIMVPLLIIAELTDFFDGYYARKRGEVSSFGKLFDPFGDVILHFTLFICLTLTGAVHPLVLALIFYREFSMNFVRLLAIEKGVAIGAGKGGKFKTLFYIVTIFYFLLFESLRRLGIAIPEVPVLPIIAALLNIGCVITAYSSFISYLVHFRTLITGKHSERSP
ncbi:MAG: CDP-diacylglycerol--glycerol-3-phosphate 3-phosphatidyltransferase [Treponema sp.]|jgi:CDP-diacylglycerol--glycerol-3-phosphate 3-phosphatidyltransferase|nr:CDP-diacylglycerol--glycerol-3-phosphate 3-phosphatidyltransferase [Treponema sp.]